MRSFKFCLGSLFLAAVCFGAAFGADDRPSLEAKVPDLAGQQAPALIGSAWEGTPISLEAVRGNAVVLAFWNGDIPC